MHNAPRRILRFWFGPTWNAEQPSRTKARRWFAGDPGFDATIRERYGRLTDEALDGMLDHWPTTPGRCLALLLLLDQFARNIYRGDGRAFAGATAAERQVLAGRAAGFDEVLHTDQRAFFYMPLMHAEDRELQDLCVACFEGLVRDAPPESRDRARNYLDFAHSHRDVVARFGRFPGRNAALGRTDTPEEAAFLAEAKGWAAGG